MTDDFCKEIAQFQEKYMVEDKDIVCKQKAKR